MSTTCPSRFRSRLSRLPLLCALLGPAACSESSDSDSKSTDESTSEADDTADTNTVDAATSEHSIESNADASAPAEDDNSGATPPGAFRYGVNAGYPNPNFDDQDLLGLELRAGSTSQRVSLPETHLERWGYDIEVADVTAYRQQGMGELVAFLTSPTREHSTAPDSVEDWELAFYAPKNLYEPVTVDGQLNPDNYWANYVYRTVSIYKPWIGIWEIWNEPDWVGDWQVTQDWDETAPTADELPHWNGSIYDYVRLLRVSREAAQLADPNAKIATGGLGYASFLDAVFRYSDDPETGEVSDAYPATGSAYVDVVSFHHYPIYSAGNSEVGVDSFLNQRAAMANVVEAHGAEVQWECTETGAPHVASGDLPGGDAYARNYLLKTMTLAQSIGLGGVHWFALSDGDVAGASTDPYDYMGLYQSVSELAEPSDSVLTQTGSAYATLTSHLRELSYDAAKTAALELPTDVRGAAFSAPGTQRTLVLWAVPNAGEEEASTTMSVETESGFTVYAFDAASTGDSERVEAETGHAALVLDGAPQIFVEE